MPAPQPIDVTSAAPVIGKVLEAVSPPGSRPECAVHRTPAHLADGIALGRPSKVSAASQIGLAHSVPGSVRQDAYDFTLTPPGRLVVAVADGMGSRPDSQVGAAHFCESVVLATEDTPNGSAADSCAWPPPGPGISRVRLRLEPEAVVSSVPSPSSTGTGARSARISDVSAFPVDGDGVLAELFAATTVT